MAIYLLDFEASSIHHGSYPVEVGWCSHDITSGYSALIQPLPKWSEWSVISEGMHGLTRQRLDCDGRPAADVMARLNADLDGVVVHSDNPEFEEKWLAKLSHDSDVVAAFTVAETPLDALLVAAARQAGTPFVPHGVPQIHPLAVEAMSKAAGLRHHVALDDCIRHAFRLAVVAIEALRDDHGDDAADTMRQGLIERARRLLAETGRPAALGGD